MVAHIILHEIVGQLMTETMQMKVSVKYQYNARSNKWALRDILIRAACARRPSRNTIHEQISFKKASCKYTQSCLRRMDTIDIHTSGLPAWREKALSKIIENGRI